MPLAQEVKLLRRLRKLATANRPDQRQTDGQLLRRFLADGDEAAFEQLVERHGTMVLGVCHGVLGQEQDAEDTWQATFLVLARRAHAIRKQHSLASWLHGVAYRLALKVKTGSSRRRAREQVVAGHATTPKGAAPVDELTLREAQAILHEELERLPDKYRTPLLLCYWQGLTRDEAAEHLGWAKGTLKEQLERARNLLRGRLTRRGLALSVALFTALLDETARAGLARSAIAAATRAAVAFAGKGAPGKIASASATAIFLAEGALRTMHALKLASMAGTLIVLGLLGLGLAFLASSSAEIPGARPEPIAQEKDASGKGQPAAVEPVDPAKVVRVIDITGSSVIEPRLPYFGVPIEIKEAGDLAKHFPEKDWAERIGRQVDSSKERLLFFRWWSYEGDVLHYRVAAHSRTKKPIAAFWNIQGKPSRDPGYYFRLFAVRHEADWQVIDAPGDETRPTVREIDLTSFVASKILRIGKKPLVEDPKGVVDKPLMIASAADLARAVPEDAQRTALQRQVDFTRERLLLFAWPGSAQDQLWFDLPEARKVRFRYAAGPDAEGSHHHRMFIVANDAAWSVERARDTAQAPLRELSLADYKGPRLFHDGTDPLTFQSLDAVAKAFPDKAWLEKRAAGIDFAKKRLLFFHWEGSGGDQIAPILAMGPRRKSVRFAYHPGETSDLRMHQALYALDRDIEYDGSGFWSRGSSFTRVNPLAIDEEQVKAAPGDFTKPIAIDSYDELTERIGGKEVAEIKRTFAIDFRTQRMLLFVWNARAGTEMAYVVQAEMTDAFAWRPVSKVTFYQSHLGKAALLRRSVRLYVLPREATWEVLPPGERPFADKR